MLRKLHLYIFTFLLSMSVLGGVVSAQDRLCNEVSGAGGSAFCSGENNDNDGSIVGSGSIINTAIELLTTAAAVIAVIMIIIGGFMYVVSNGDAGRTSRGRATIIYAIVGLVVAIFARVILLFILNRIG